MRKSMKKSYMVPVCDVHKLECGAFMIEIGSGNTSPEESDANGSFFQEEETESFYRTRNLWEE